GGGVPAGAGSWAPPPHGRSGDGGRGGRTTPRGRRGVGARSGPPATSALPLLADRPRARPPRPRDRPAPEAAASRPAGGLARPAPGHPGLGRSRRAGAPRIGLAGQRVVPHRGGVGRARPARLPGTP